MSWRHSALPSRPARSGTIACTRSWASAARSTPTTTRGPGRWSRCRWPCGTPTTRPVDPLSGLVAGSGPADNTGAGTTGRVPATPGRPGPAGFGEIMLQQLIEWANVAFSNPTRGWPPCTMRARSMNGIQVESASDQARSFGPADWFSGKEEDLHLDYRRLGLQVELFDG